MNVAIMTYSSAQNYGAQLQAYALEKTIAEMGVECSIVYYRSFDERWFKPRKTIMDIIVTMLLYRQGKRRIRSYKTFRENNLKLTELIENEAELNALNDSFDAFVSGSDQVWNCSGRVNEAFFLRFVDKSKIKVAYAPSFGSESIPDACRKTVVKYINDFDYVSIRENSGKKLILELTGKEVPVVLDPVFLREKSEWENFIESKGNSNYIFVYTTQVNKLLEDTIKMVQKNLGCPVVSTQYIPGCNCKAKKDIGPIEFLQYISEAKYIVSTSFHATAFSIIFEKSFCVVPHSQTGARVKDLLTDLGIADRIVESSKKLDFAENVDWLSVRKALKHKRELSMSYLRNALGGGVGK